MIEVKHVTKTFDGFRALDGLTMSVPDGSIYGLVGPNGAGKSTILRHITGIYRQDEGEVLVAGSRCTKIRRSRPASPPFRMNSIISSPPPPGT